MFCYIQKKKTIQLREMFVLNDYIYTKWNHLWHSSFYHPFQKIFFYHLFYFLPGFAGKWFVIFQFHVLVREGIWVEDGAPWVSCTSAGNLAVEDLAEHIEERQELLNTAHGTEGEQQVPWLPTQRSPWVVFLWIFLQRTKWELSLIDNVVQGCQTHFHQGPHQPCSCLQRAECNFRTV